MTMTSYEIKFAILTHLCTYQDNKEPKIMEHWAPGIQAASQAQAKLRQNAFAEGLLVNHWKQLQAQHVADKGTKIDPG